MNFSYWENKWWVGKTDFLIIGSGITGLTTSIFLKEKFPNSSIRILERGITPWGASTKNAGFACFGSPSEILSDIEEQGLQKTMKLVEKRWEGLQELIRITKNHIGLEPNGGYEIFTDSQSDLSQKCFDNIASINNELNSIIGENVYECAENTFGFNGVDKIIRINFEAQIDTGLMMKSLYEKALEVGVDVLFGAEYLSYERVGNELIVELKGGMKLKCDQLIFCNNGFASELTKIKVKPARAQVLITKPISNLRIKGTFHMDEGFYYFRNIDNRILFGGGRNLDFNAEETTEMECSDQIITELERLLKEVILPDTNFEVDYHWAGIMGVGESKEPIIQKIEEGVYCGVKLGGMGVAIGSLVGKELSELIEY